MKKIFSWAAVLCILFSLTGCLKIYEEFPSLTKGTPLSPEWKSFTFKSLAGGEDLVVSRETLDEESLSISTTKYPQNILAVAMYTTDCEVCKMQAPYFDKLAEDIPADKGMDFAIVFLDIFEDSENKEVEWIKDLKHVEAYTNVATACEGGACRKVFTPYNFTPLPGTIYYVNKQDVSQSTRGISWNVSLQTPAQLYREMLLQAAHLIGLELIFFDASVDGYIEGGSATIPI